MAELKDDSELACIAALERLRSQWIATITACHRACAIMGARLERVGTDTQRLAEIADDNPGETAALADAMAERLIAVRSELATLEALFADDPAGRA